MKTKTKMTSKGQITIPRPIRERMGLKPGDELEFIEENGACYVKKHLGPNPFSKYRGCLKELAGRDPDEIVREMRGE